jgi:hypothetical protein
MVELFLTLPIDVDNRKTRVADALEVAEFAGAVPKKYGRLP